MLTIEGHAIVSADGMIADAEGTYPPALRNDADWAQYQRALAASVLSVTGRRGHQRFPNPGRRRLVITRSVARLGPDANDPLATFWNPAALPLRAALAEVGVTDGVVAITGVFGLFVADFDRFQLSENHRLTIPGGVPCFAHGHPRVILSHAGFRPTRVDILDPVAMVSSTHWTRPLDSLGPSG